MNAAHAHALQGRFIFDSSHHLNCHSNFIPKIAPLERHRSNKGVYLPGLGRAGGT
jgi:hypothetical protein